MREKSEKWIWLRHVAVAGLYFASFTALRDVSFTYWLLPAGLRLLCLLFVPYRFWPALAVGEMLSLGIVSYQCRDSLGHTWALLNLFPTIVLAMPIVHWSKTRLGLFGPRHTVHLNTLILCTFLVAIVSAARTYPVAYLGALVSGEHASFAWAQGYFIGNYLGILTIVPLALMLWKVCSETSLHALWSRLSNSRLAFDSVAMLLPSLILLMWTTAHIKGDLGQIAHMAMFLPVAALALRHGWYGAAIGGSLASVAMAVGMPAKQLDPTTMQAEVFMAFTITVMLILGARIAALGEKEEKERLNSRLALQVAQEGLYMSEQRMQQAAETIQQIGEGVRYAQDRLLAKFHQFLPASQGDGFQKQAAATQHELFHLADGIHPRALSQNGLEFALQHGRVALAFTNENVGYECILTGTSLDKFTPSAKIALYRLASEAAVYMFEQAKLTHVTVRVRAGVTRSKHWAVLQMDAFHARDRDGPMPSQAECKQFRERLGASSRRVEEIRTRTRVYGGTARARHIANGTRLSLLLHDIDGTLAPH